MGKFKHSLGAALVLALLLVFASPARTQDAQETTPGESEIQSTAPGNSEQVQPEQKETAPAATHHTTTKKHKAVHHKHKKKKKAHKAAKKRHAKKHVRKKHAATHRTKEVKKTTTAEKPKKDVQQEALPPAKTESTAEMNQPEKAQEAEKETATPKAAMVTPAIMEPKTAGEPKAARESEQNSAPEAAKEPEKIEKSKKVEKEKHAPKMASAAPRKSAAAPAPHKTKTAAAPAGSKTVTYTFCLGYDNCTPYRYEAMVHGGGADAKIFKENPEGGGWIETKIDPVMESDLSAMARSEPGSDVARPLSVTEKARIADHQGKAHVDLVAAANDGRKDQVKQMMKDLRIKNADDLSAYDARLAKNDTAMQAANELAAGR